MKKIVVKVSMPCQNCKTCVMKTVAKLEGIDHLSVDVEKGTLTVVGVVDPVCIIRKLRKSGKTACIDSVGPNKKEEPKPDVKPDPLPQCCRSCQPVAYGFVTMEEPNYCTIL